MPKKQTPITKIEVPTKSTTLFGKKSSKGFRISAFSFDSMFFQFFKDSEYYNELIESFYTTAILTAMVLQLCSNFGSD
jgi:hypothetical protein